MAVLDEVREVEDRFDVPDFTWTEAMVEGYWGVEDDGASAMIWLDTEGVWVPREEWKEYLQSERIHMVTQRCLPLGGLPEGVTSEWVCPDQDREDDDDIPF